MKKFLVIVLLLRSFASTSQINSRGSNTVSVPIYNLSEGNVSIPISLDYDGSGIQVANIASRVGQNWSLNVGGKIVRSIRDKPDEAAIKVSSDNSKNVDGKFYKNSYDLNKPLLYLQDLENDIFTLNLNGRSIAFIIDNTSNNYAGNASCFNFSNNIKLLNDVENIQIEFMQYRGRNELFNINSDDCLSTPIDDPYNKLTYKNGPEIFNIEKDFRSNTFTPNVYETVIQYFRVSMPDGTQYYFGETEREREYSFTFDNLANLYNPINSNLLSSGNIIYPNSWVLSRIILPSNNESFENGPNVGTKRQEIVFNYDRELTVLENINYISPFKKFNVGFTNCVPQQYIEIDNNKKPILLESVIKSIETTNFSVNFNSSEIFGIKNSLQGTDKIPDFSSNNFDNLNREDVIGWNNSASQNLSSIPKSKALKNILIKDKVSNKKFAFYLDQGYFKTYYYNPPGPNIVEDQGRLKLNGLYQIEMGNNPSVKEGKHFSYIDGILPSTTSFAKDHWGFYNGEDANVTKTGLIEVPDDLTLTGALFGGAFNCLPPNSYGRSNLNAKEEFTRIGILNKMESTTGNSIEYTYEGHECNNYFENKRFDETTNSWVRDGVKKVGGLRLKSLISTDYISNDKIKKEYIYSNEESGQSYGELALWPTYFFSEMNSGGLYCVPNSFSNMSSRFNKGGYLNYTKIKEKISGIKNNIEESNGYSIYEFYGQNFIPETLPYQLFSSSSWGNESPTKGGRAYSRYRFTNSIPPTNQIVGNLKSIESYNPQGVLITKNLSILSSDVPINSLSQAYFSYPYVSCAKPIIGNNEYQNFDNFPVPHVSIEEQLQNMAEQKFMNQIYSLASIGQNSFQAQQFGNLMIAIQIVQFGINFINSLEDPIDCSVYNTPNYTLTQNKIRVSQNIVTQFDKDGLNPFISKTSMIYSPNNNHNVAISTKTEKYKENNILLSTFEKIEKYNKDFIIPAGTTDPISLGIKALNDRNMLVPIETYTVKDGKVIGGTINHYYSDVSKEGFVKKTYSLELAKPINLAAFNPSSVDPSSGIFTTDPNYRVTTKFNSYNDKGLVTEIENVKEFKDNTNTPGVEFIQSKTTIAYTHNNLIKSSVTTQGLGSDTRTTTYESIPLFGETRRTLPNNDAVKTEYDDLGRVKFIRDKDENILKSYIYNDKIPSSSLSFSINNRTETLLTLEDVGSYEKTILAGQTSLALKSDLIGFGAKSVQLKFTNPAGVTTTVNSSNTTQSIFYSDISNQTWNIGGYYVEVLAYRGENTQGDIVGRRKIFFNIIDSTINQQRTIKPKN